MEIEKVSGDYRPLILVAEDDDSNFKLIKAIIGKKCEILWAKNGEDIVNLFVNTVTGWKMMVPVMNSLEAIDYSPRRRNIACYHANGYAFTTETNAARAVLRKYWTLSTLRNCLSR